MKKRTSNVSRRIVSLLMSLVLTLTLVTPAAFATEVVGGSGTAIIEGNANPADPAPGEDSENNEDKNTEDGKDEQPTEPGDEDKNPDEDNGDDASKPDGDSKDKENPDGDKKDEENKNEQPTEDENDGEDEIALLNAENAADAWDGKDVNTDWYTKAEDGTGTADKPYEINTAAELAGLAALVNGTAKDAGNNPIAAANFKDKTIKLTADIDLGNQAWTPIGNENGFAAKLAFSGTFNGDGYTVSGLNVPDTYFPGLFGQISASAAVQNLIVKGSVTGGDKAYDIWGEAAGVVCDNNGTVQNCGFYGSVNDEIGLDAGGVAGGGNGEVRNCWYYMTDKSSSVSAVSVCTATNCVVISSSDNMTMTADKLTMLQKNAPKTGKVWSWKEGDAYPTLVSNVSRSMTLKPYLNSCTAKVAVSGLTGESGVYLLENGVNTVTLLLDSGYSGENVYVRTNAANADRQIQLTTSGVSVPIGNAEKTILYYGTEDDFEAGKWYTAGDAPYQISTGRELVYLAQLVNDGNNFSGKTIKLTADIDLGNKEWTPIGNTSDMKFAGTFDGQGYTIRGLCINATTDNQGLFGYIDKSAIVQNLIVTGSVTTSKGFTGGIVGRSTRSQGTVRNCGFYGTVTATGTSGGVVGSGKALNCWYYHTGEAASNLGVCGGTATNCVMISSTDLMTAAKLETLKTAAPVTGKVWSWTEGAAYPTLIDPPKTITMQPVFPDCTAVVSANGTALAAANGYTYEVEEDAVITVSGNSGTLYYATSEGAKAYTTEGENANLTKLEDSTPFNKNDLPKTYYYGTKDDFDTIAVWNSALNGNTATIKDADTLKALARMVNSGKDSMAGKTIMLGADIRLNNDAVPTSGNQWTPIGTEKNPFKGTFTGYSRSGGYAAISDLSDDLFGVVHNSKTKIQYVTISGGTGRLVNTLKSGTVENCMSTAEVTGAGGGLVGTSTGTVKNSYYYNENCKNIVAVSGDGTITNCYYLADTSTWGQTGDTGARTEAEFKAGRVTWELNGKDAVYRYNVTTYWSMGENDLPCLETYNAVYELTLTVNGTLPEGASLQLGDASIKVLTDGNTQYVYRANSYGAPMVPVSAEVPDGYQVMYSPNAPTNGKFKIDGFTKANNYYTVEFVKGDISWYEANKDSKSYAFKTADELVGFSLLVNGSTGTRVDFEGWTLTLANDINLDGIAWTPIGQSNAFSGTFDGKGHTIEDMSANVTSGYAGLFGNVRGMVKNVQVTGSVTASGKVRAVGGIVGYSAGGTVQNCLSKVNILASQVNCPVGGVVGDSSNNPSDNTSSTVNLCWNEGTVTGGSDSTGGIVGANSNGTVTNCANFGEVKGSSTASGIVGSGTAVANSYNLGDVTGAGGSAYGISSGAAVNSYYVCKLNGTEKMAYVNNAPEAEVKYNEADKTYTVGEDAALLVDKLNENRSSGTPWFVNQDKGVYLPIHVLDWTGKQDERFSGKVITITYEPNGGVNKGGGDAPISVSVTLMPNLSTGGFEAVQYTILAANDETLGFKHENGTIKATPWNTDATGNGSPYAAGRIIQVSEDITLYAQWDKIWGGDGSNSDPYQIFNAEKLTALQTQVNENGFSYTGKWFRLTNNIDLNNELWTPIGVDSLHFFGGSLDGGGKTISGLKVETDRQWAGLFGSVRGTYGVPMTMRDLTLKNGSVKFTSSGTSCSGGLVAIVEGETALELRNVVAENLTVSGGDDSGGLLGRGRVAMTNCHNRGGSVTGRYAGGLAGNGYSNLLNHVFTGCTNSAKVVGERTAGGMTGNETVSNGSYTSCANSGSISATQGYASGIAAGGSYKQCSNSGAVTGKQAAGITYNGNKATFCSNTGTITGTDYAAGILTNGGYGGTVEFCWNTGSVEASTPVKAFGILYGWGAYNRVRNSFSYVPGANIGLAPTELKEKNVSDSYYLADKKDSVSSAGEWASADDFASGKVAWGVDGGVNAHKNYWTQGANNYPVPIGEGTSTSYYRAKAECGTGGAVSIKSSRNFTGDADNAVYGPKGMSVTVTATPKDDTFGLKSLTLDLMGTGSATALDSGDSFTLGEANALVVATFASTGNGGGTGGNGGDGDGTGTDTGDGAGDENDEGLQDGLNLEVEYDVKSLILSAYGAWGAESSGKTFAQWLKDSPEVLRALITNSLDNMAVAAMGKKTDEAKDLAALLLASLNEHSGLDGQSSDTIGKMLRKYIESGTEAAFSAWLTTGGGMASGTYESIFAQYTNSLLALADRLYTNWESSGTSLTFPQWLDAQQVTMESLSENAEEPDAEPDDTQTTEAPEDVPDGQEAEGGASSGGNSVWEVIGTVVRENPIIVWSIVAVIAALVIVGAVRRYHKVKRDERDDVSSKK